MNPQTDPLAALKPIQLPPEPHWFPPAPGWWLLALAIVLGLIGLAWLWRRRQKRIAPLKQALDELEQLQSSLQGSALMQALNQLLRRAARQAYGPQSASLGEQAWADFLKKNAPAELQQTPERWQHIAQAAYQQQAPERSGEYIALGRAWLKSNLSC